MTLLPAAINETESRFMRIIIPQQKFQHIVCPVELFKESGTQETGPESIH